MIWLAFNAVFGIYNLAKYDDSVLKAFNPYYAFDYLIRNKEHGWRSLGGILLLFLGSFLPPPNLIPDNGQNSVPISLQTIRARQAWPHTGTAISSVMDLLYTGQGC